MEDDDPLYQFDWQEELFLLPGQIEPAEANDGERRLMCAVLALALFDVASTRRKRRQDALEYLFTEKPNEDEHPFTLEAICIRLGVSMANVRRVAIQRVERGGRAPSRGTSRHWYGRRKVAAGG